MRDEGAQTIAAEDRGEGQEGQKDELANDVRGCQQRRDSLRCGRRR